MIGIGEPAGLVGLVAAAALVVLHLLERRRRPTAVSTLRLWKRLPAHTLAPRRLQTDLPFVLQMASVLALVAALARTYVAGAPAGTPADALALVVDVSASMGTQEAGGTRLELARRRARALVDALPPTAETMLVTAGVRPTVRLRWTADRGTLLGHLEALEALDVGTNLGPGVDVALASAAGRAAARVAVLTDVPREESGVPAASLARVDYVEIGRTGANAAITALRVDVAPFAAPGRATLVAEVRNFDHVARRATLVARVGDRPWGQRTLELPARGIVTASLTEPPEAGVVTLALDGGDALPADDRGVAWIPPPAPFDLVLVTDDDALVHAFRAIARTLPGARVEAVGRAAWSGAAPRPGATVILDGIVPAGPLRTATLVLDPPSDNALCPVGPRIGGAAVVDWAIDHPALAGLGDLQAIELGGIRRLDVPSWGASTVLAAAPGGAFPLLVTGERDGVRVACLAVRPVLASPDDVPLLVLVLGTLRWLAEASGAAPILATAGAAVPIGDGDGVVMDRVGARTVATPAGERLVLANLLDPRESDVGRAAEREWSATLAPEAGGTQAPPRTELWWWLALGATLVLAAEWVVWALR